MFPSSTIRSLRRVNFQDMIGTLNAYWGERGAVIMQPYHTELGAGTSNPATFLRVLDPTQPEWRAAYVEPVIRPADGRYGENPFRFQHYFQYQVILKPAPEDVLDQYFGSLDALGIDLAEARHPPRRGRLGAADARRLGPRLGGLVRRDGGHAVHVLPAARRDRPRGDPGGDDLRARAARALPAGQEVGARPRVGAGRDLGRRVPENERQWSQYNYEEAPVDVLQRRFDEHEAEAEELLEKNLPLPAYDQVLKSSHAFNLLDARGAVSVTERAAYIGRVRKLARRFAQLYVGADGDAPG